MRRGTLVVVTGLLALTALKLWWCGRIELSPDEAYYRLWSQRLDWAYFSKGPGVALAIHFATALAGDTERGVRWLSPLLGLGTTAVLWLLVRDALSRATATATVVVLQVVPLFTVGSLLMTIDPPAVFLWTLALLCGWRALQRGGGAWWAAAGVACGLGFLCKYTNAMALAGLLLAAWCHPPTRRPWLLPLAFAPFTLPPLLWNARHGWPSVAHLLERGGLGRGAWLQPRETLEFVAAHFGTWSPVIFALVLAALPAAVRDARRAPGGARFLLLASAPVLGLYATLALHEAGEANWTAPGVLGLLPLAVHRAWERRRSWAVRIAAPAGIVLSALLSLAVANTDLLRAAGVPLSARQDPGTRLRGWRETAGAVREMAGRGPVVSSHYGLASELAFYGGIPARVPATPAPRSQLWFWQDERVTEDYTYVSDRPNPPGGATCEPVGERAIHGSGGTLRVIRAWRCDGAAAR